MGTRPQVILTDKLGAYNAGVRRNFYSNRTPNAVMHGHIHFAAEANNNMIERFHGTLKERTKVMRHLKRAETAHAILDGFTIEYNFLREHEAIGGLTPAAKAGIDLPFEDGWGDLIRWATHYRARTGQLT